MGKLFNKKRIFIIISMLALLLSGVGAFSQSSMMTEAAGGACSAIGSNMDINRVAMDPTGASSPEADGRKWTVQELFGNSVTHSTFYGEGPRTWLLAEKINRGEGLHDGWNEDVQTTIDETRSMSCIIAGALDGIINFSLWGSNMLTSVTGWIVMSLIGEDMMAGVLTTIIGGDGTSGNDGLIGTFLSSFYMPLVVLAVIIMVATLIYKGLIKMQMREALGSMIWTLGAFVIGVTLMLQPQILAGAPQVATSTITTCVLGALSGQNCLSDEVETPSMLAAQECISTASGTRSSDAEAVVNGMNCTIWKTFVLEPWAEQQFGAPYDELYTDNIPSGGSEWENLPEGEASTYCVSLNSSASYADSIRGGTPVMDESGSICNVALYHLYLKTDMKDTANHSGSNHTDSAVWKSDDTGKYDSRWYNIIVPMAQDQSKWRNWSGDGQFFSKAGSVMFGFIATIAASSVLLVLAIFGGAYKIVGLVLMAFAPIFLLFAIEPTKGRKIFLGWLETLVSSILKYFAIVVLIVVALVMYSGLLSNTTGIASFVGILVMTVALHMYRKEIVNLIGASNMGGERLSNKVNEMGGKAGKFAKEKGSAAVGGAIGGAIGNATARHANVKQRKDTIKDLQESLANASTEEEKDFYTAQIKAENEEIEKHGSFAGSLTKGAGEGGIDSAKRAMKRGTGIGANIFQQSDRTKDEVIRDNQKTTGSLQKDREAFESKMAARRGAEESQQSNSQKIPNSNATEAPGTQSESQSGPQSDEEVINAPKTESEIKRDIAIKNLRDSEREELPEYEGNLTEHEREALDDFADRLRGDEYEDYELAQMANSEAVMNDPNKKALVANELNARLKANTLAGVGSHAISRTNLTDNTLVSNEELELNLSMLSSEYMETGDEGALNRYMGVMQEKANRDGHELDTESLKAEMSKLRSEVGDAYVRPDILPTDEEIEGKDNVEVELPNGKRINLGDVETPADLEIKQKDSPELTEARKAQSEVLREREGAEQTADNESSQNAEQPEGANPEQPGRSTTLPDFNDIEEPVDKTEQTQEEPKITPQSRSEQGEEKRYEQPEGNQDQETTEQPVQERKAPERAEQQAPERAEQPNPNRQEQPEQSREQDPRTPNERSLDQQEPKPKRRDRVTNEESLYQQEPPARKNQAQQAFDNKEAFERQSQGLPNLDETQGQFKQPERPEPTRTQEQFKQSEKPEPNQSQQRDEPVRQESARNQRTEQQEDRYKREDPREQINPNENNRQKEEPVRREEPERKEEPKREEPKREEEPQRRDTQETREQREEEKNAKREERENKREERKQRKEERKQEKQERKENRQSGETIDNAGNTNVIDNSDTKSSLPDLDDDLKSVDEEIDNIDSMMDFDDDERK